MNIHKALKLVCDHGNTVNTVESLLRTTPEMHQIDAAFTQIALNVELARQTILKHYGMKDDNKSVRPQS